MYLSMSMIQYNLYLSIHLPYLISCTLIGIILCFLHFFCSPPVRIDSASSSFGLFSLYYVLIYLIGTQHAFFQPPPSWDLPWFSEISIDRAGGTTVTYT